MSKTVKRVFYASLLLMCMFLFKIDNLKAACNIGVSAPSSVIVGKTFTVTTTVSGSNAIGSWEYTLSYDSSQVRYNSGSLHVVDYGNGSKKSASYSYTFTALKSGNATFKAVNASVLDYASTNECLSNAGSTTVVMKTQAEIEESYSRNNNLSSLSVEGGTLSPEFSPSVTEYSVTMPVDTTKVNVLATAQDKTASVTGAGAVDVVDGINKIELVVTAQHGEKKSYIINLTVQELDPITIDYAGKKYTVVRKKGQIENIPTGFIEDTIKINDQDIAAYKSEITNLTLIGLKDEEGIISLFIYDESKKEVRKFIQGASSILNLIILDNNQNSPKGFMKSSFKINNQDVKGYKVKGSKDGNHFLIYAQNLENGDKNFYLYDSKNNTYQIYFDELSEKLLEEITLREYAIYGLLGLIGLILLIKIISVLPSNESKIRRLQKKINKLKKKDANDYYFETVNEEAEEKEEIAKEIDKEDINIPKKSKKEKNEELKKAKERLNKSRGNIKRVSLDEEDF